MNSVTGSGDHRIAQDLYRSAALAEIARMRREGVYICIGNVIARMPAYNLEILNGTLWALAFEGKLS
jgi:hypothetical protein